VEFQVDGGEWRNQNLFTNWSATLHIPWTYVLDADLRPGRHELVMRIAAGADSRSTGHAVRLAHLLAN
jgi:sialidase-1